jgi:putative SOS response-associated peptidase YedK
MEFGTIDHVQGVGVFGNYPIIYENREDGKLHCRLMEWSVIEFWQKEEPSMVKRNGMLNIRSERILDDSTSYWHKIRNRRCLIPLTGTFEHREVKGWKKKVPYLIRPCEQKVFFLPGLYSVAEIADKNTGEMIKRWSFGMITRKANPVMMNIHNGGDNRGRMPLFTPLEMSKEFVKNELEPQRYKEILNYEMPSEDLVHHPVYTIRTGKLRDDGKSKVDAYDWAQLPELGVGNPD